MEQGGHRAAEGEPIDTFLKTSSDADQIIPSNKQQLIFSPNDEIHWLHDQAINEHRNRMLLNASNLNNNSEDLSLKVPHFSPVQSTDQSEISSELSINKAFSVIGVKSGVSASKHIFGSVSANKLHPKGALIIRTALPVYRVAASISPKSGPRKQMNQISVTEMATASLLNSNISDSGDRQKFADYTLHGPIPSENTESYMMNISEMFAAKNTLEPVDFVEDSLGIARNLFDHEKRLVNFLLETNNELVDSYQTCEKHQNAQNTPMTSQLMYSACWSSFRVCKAVEILSYRTGNSPSFYQIFEGPHILQQLMQDHFSQLVADNPHSVLISQPTFDQSARCHQNLSQWKDFAQRNLSTSDQKTILSQWVSPLGEFRPASIHNSRISEIQQSTLFELICLHEHSKGTIPNHLLFQLERCIGINFLFFLAENLSAIGKSKTSDSAATALVELDWECIYSLKKQESRAHLLELAREHYLTHSNLKSSQPSNEKGS